MADNLNYCNFSLPRCWTCSALCTPTLPPQEDEALLAQTPSIWVTSLARWVWKITPLRQLDFSTCLSTELLLIAYVCVSHQNKSGDKFKRPFKKRHSSVYHQPSNRVNKYLAQAIEARSVDREKADHVTLTTLCFRDHNKESQVGETICMAFNFRGYLQQSVFSEGAIPRLLVGSCWSFVWKFSQQFFNWIFLSCKFFLDGARHRFDKKKVLLFTIINYDPILL